MTRDRLHQIKRWFEARYECKVRLRVERKMPKEFVGCLGSCQFGEDGEPPLIRVLLTNRSESVSTLLHELAHALDYFEHGWVDGRKNEGHDFRFARYLYELESEFIYGGGVEESKFF